MTDIMNVLIVVAITALLNMLVAMNGAFTMLAMLVTTVLRKYIAKEKYRIVLMVRTMMEMD